MEIGDFTDDGWEISKVITKYIIRKRIRINKDINLKVINKDIHIKTGQLGYIYNDENRIYLTIDCIADRNFSASSSINFDIIEDIRKIRKKKLDKIKKRIDENI